ncbi:ABC transporter permease [Maridesulfovibrio salexigens]|uniref:Binding-protein-dependent transport systems inner membrane component n=1 Tax=Maridesulfovibrio salexigens (strain ATCC 14822 / DSM 2638 / NCIMB 8403 / VKM B-1763) TaxID=526222 RepID=C6BYF0_MARSD|nr:proline/glycine betaine ABC transporter permease [Maridesulfovibrio salexigens]ACS78741.1 binding-protein-dependent transport systems inner membrane component [Maridesulfovibrio salexigens DSM 2638]
MNVPRIPIGEVIESSIDFLVEHFSFATKAFSAVLEAGLDVVEGTMKACPPWLFIFIVAAITLRLTKSKRTTIFSIAGLLLIWNIGLWKATVSTIALVIVSTLLALLFGIPIGILAAMNKHVNKIVMPVLDVMQTMPAFVYLIPAIPFFGLGKVAAIFSTIIFAMPPSIRLTCLGIKQVPEELVECAEAFGSNRWQRLFKLELPIATPTIMAGVNQTVMLALSMVVIAAMIGAKGLGGEVWKAIQRLQMGKGFEAGIGIVIVAMIMDRVLQNIGSGKKK